MGLADPVSRYFAVDMERPLLQLNSCLVVTDASFVAMLFPDAGLGRDQIALLENAD